jgi:hypothetical protein
MLQVYRDTGSFLTSSSPALPGAIIWIDLLNPTPQEKEFVESRTGVARPVRAIANAVQGPVSMRAKDRARYGGFRCACCVPHVPQISAVSDDAECQHLLITE